MLSFLGLPKQRDAFHDLTTQAWPYMSKSKTDLYWLSCLPGVARHFFFFFCLALNLIGPRAVDVLSELSYAPMTPDHFPSLFCKVSAIKVLLFKWAENTSFIQMAITCSYYGINTHKTCSDFY